MYPLEIRGASIGRISRFSSLNHRGVWEAAGTDLSALSVWLQCLWLSLCKGAIQLQIALFCFNLFLPAFPLDGGRIFANMLLIRV
jgi:Zn-dependent protease